MSVDHTTDPTGRPTGEPILKAHELAKHFPMDGFGRSRKVLRAVDGVSLEIGRGETLGLVGESGSGKTTVGRTLIRLYQPTSGTVEFEGHEITRSSGNQLRHNVRRRMSMVFQNPSTSLDPYLRLGDALTEPLVVHGVGDAATRRDRVAEMMELVGLDASMAERYPQELSGGQRQRIGIARALITDPSLIIADEPTASLDVSVQAQIVNLLGDLQQELGPAHLFITHDLALVRHKSPCRGDVPRQAHGGLPSALPVQRTAAPLFRRAGVADFTALIIPWIVLSIYGLATLSRLTRGQLLDAFTEGHVATARSKGISPARVLLLHALPTALPPVLAWLGIQFSLMFSALLILEPLMNYNGLGALLVGSVSNRDFPVIQASVFSLAVLITLVNILMDTIVRTVDPRLRTKAAQ